MSEPCLSRLVLGTVQLGIPYGVANRTGRPDMDAARSLVAAAWKGGVRIFDTAQGYGDSEAVLGQIFRDLDIAEEARVITKYDPRLDHDDPTALRVSLEQSLERLGVARLEGVLLHRQEFLEHWQAGPGPVAEDLRRQGLLSGAGVSVYAPEHALEALDLPGLDMLQLPVNPLDRRFEKAGVFDAAARRSAAVFARSVYLQGLLLMEPSDLPVGLAQAAPVLERFQGLAASLGLEPAAACLAFVREGLPEVNVVFGAETEVQVSENLSLWMADAPARLAEELREAFPDVAETILNPSLWKTT